MHVTADVTHLVQHALCMIVCFRGVHIQPRQTCPWTDVCDTQSQPLLFSLLVFPQLTVPHKPLSPIATSPEHLMASRNRYARRGPLVLRHPGERPRYSRKTGRSTREHRPPASYDLNSEHRTGSVFPSDSWRAGPRGMRSTGRQPDKVFSPSRESLRELRLHQATSTGSKPSWLCKISAMGSAMVFILFSFTEVGESTRALLAPCSERSIRGPPSPHLEERMPRATAGIPLHYSAQARSKTCNLCLC